MERSVDFRKANMEPSVNFRRANTETYWKQNVNLSKSVGKDRVFLGLAGLLLGISLGLRPREIPRSSLASPRKTPSFRPLLLRLTQYCCPYVCISVGHARVTAWINFSLLLIQIFLEFFYQQNKLHYLKLVIKNGKNVQQSMHAYVHYIMYSFYSAVFSVQCTVHCRLKHEICHRYYPNKKIFPTRYGLA